MGASDRLVMAFRFEKATKNTFKYEEKPEPGQPSRIGSLYVQKWAFGTESPPERLQVRVENASGSSEQGKESG